MFYKMLPLFVAMGVSITAQQASAYYVDATAEIKATGDKPDAVLCRKAPNQALTERQEFTKKNECESHDSCTAVKANARSRLNAQQMAPYDVCTKYVRTDDPCVKHCR